jgi:WD40 repeat protein
LLIQIEQVFTLSGHEDWIRTITIQKTSRKRRLLFLLFIMIFDRLATLQWFVGTCSQDNYIRIWQLTFDENNNQTNIDAATLKLKRSSFVLKNSGMKYSFIEN